MHLKLAALIIVKQFILMSLLKNRQVVLNGSHREKLQESIIQYKNL